MEAGERPMDCGDGSVRSVAAMEAKQSERGLRHESHDEIALLEWRR